MLLALCGELEKLFNHSRLQKRLSIKEQRGALVLVLVLVEAAAKKADQTRLKRVSERSAQVVCIYALHGERK